MQVKCSGSNRKLLSLVQKGRCFSTNHAVVVSSAFRFDSLLGDGRAEEQSEGHVLAVSSAGTVMIFRVESASAVPAQQAQLQRLCTLQAAAQPCGRIVQLWQLPGVGPQRVVGWVEGLAPQSHTAAIWQLPDGGAGELTVQPATLLPGAFKSGAAAAASALDPALLVASAREDTVAMSCLLPPGTSTGKGRLDPDY